MFNPFFHPLRQALINYALPSGGGLSFKTIKQYPYSLTDVQSTVDVTIDSVDTSKSFIVITCRADADVGGDFLFSISACEFINSTTVRITRGCFHPTIRAAGRFTVYEIDSGVSSITFQKVSMSGQSQVDVTVSTFDISKTLLFRSFYRGGAGADPTHYLNSIHLVGTTTVRLLRQVGDATNFPHVHFFLVRLS